jgi:hypothetical protein
LNIVSWMSRYLYPPCELDKLAAKQLHELAAKMLHELEDELIFNLLCELVELVYVPSM